MKILNDITQAIGGTPLVRLGKIEEEYCSGTGVTLLAKPEYLNPGGSAKDRLGLGLIEDAEEGGLIQPGATIIEPTSGNTGIGLALVSRVKGYRLILTMPETMSLERRNLLAAYGAELVLTPGSQGMAGSVKKAQELHDSIPGSFIPGQFDNPANGRVHYRTTGPEIWEDTEGSLDIYIATFGTGGTLSGAGRFLKEQKPEVKVIGVEPASSPLVTEGKAGPHKIQGIGANFLPDNFDRDICDEVVTVTNEAAYEMCAALLKTSGVFAGISAGAAVSAAAQIAARPENAGKTIVVVLPDSGERYISTGVFN